MCVCACVCTMKVLRNFLMFSHRPDRAVYFLFALVVVVLVAPSEIDVVAAVAGWLRRRRRQPVRRLHCRRARV
jgi:hypothetical protein